MFGIVLKFHSQTTSVEGVITIPVIILKQHAACCFIGLTMNDIPQYGTVLPYGAYLIGTLGKFVYCLGALSWYCSFSSHYYTRGATRRGGGHKVQQQHPKTDSIVSLVFYRCPMAAGTPSLPTPSLIPEPAPCTTLATAYRRPRTACMASWTPRESAPSGWRSPFACRS